MPTSSAARAPDPVHLDVVGVAVAAVVVVGRDDVGLLLAEDHRQAGGSLVERGLRERPGHLAGRRAHHPRVHVAEELDPVDAQEPGRLVGLGGAADRQGLAVVQHARHGLAVLAPRRDHEHHPVPEGLRLGHRPGGRDGLVVGVRVEGDEGRHVRRSHRSTGARRSGLRDTPQSARTSSVCWPAWGGGRAHLARGATEAWRRTGLHDAGHLDERAAVLVVRVLRRLGERQHGREADVGALHDLAPLVAGLLLEDRGQPLLERRPLRPVVLPRQVLTVEAGVLQQLGVELRLDRTDRDVLAVGGLVRVVEVGARVEHVRAPCVLPDAHRDERVEHRGEQGRAVDHRGVDHLALTGAAGLEQRGADAEGEQHRPAAEVADHVERRHRALTLAADRVERARQGDVVDVVAGGVARTGPPGPSRSCARTRASGCARGTRRDRGRGAPSRRDGTPRSSASAWATSSRTVATPSGCLRSTATDRRPRFEQVGRGRLGVAADGARRTVDPDDLGAEVGHDHRAEGSGPDARHLDHLEPREGALTVRARLRAHPGRAPVRPARPTAPRAW